MNGQRHQHSDGAAPTAGRLLHRLVGLTMSAGLLVAAGSALAGPASADTPPDTAPSISASPLGAIQADQAFSFAYDVQGNPAPTLAVTAGGLPPGLTLEGYVIHGQATDPGTYTWTVTAHNGIGSDATATDTIDVMPAPASIGGNPPRGNVGEPYDYTFTLGGDPLPTATVTRAELPPGLTLAPNGRISGVPTADGFFDFDITADNGTSPAAVWSGAIYVDPVPPSVTGAPPTAYVGRPYDFSFAVAGGPTPTLSIYNGVLPPGLTLSPSGGLSGTPTQAGSYGFGIEADNDAGRYEFIFGIQVLGGTPSVSAWDWHMAEGDRGTHRMTIPVTLSNPTSKTVRVHWRTYNGRARAGSDYRAASGTLTFRPGETVKVITVLIIGDRRREPDETFTVRLTSPTGARLGDARAIGTIDNDD